MSKDFVRVLRSIIQHVDELQEEDDPSGNGFTREFRKIREEQNNDKKNDRFSAEEGKKPSNIKKNRYKDIIPYDYTRVKLTPLNDEETDYINASFVKDAYEKNGYIASQGPLPHTVDDFWRMLWEYRIEVVFAACREWEDRKHKCQRYWATSEDEKPLVFGNITVSLEKEQELFEDFYMRELVAHKGGEVQRLTQFHYCGWPDHGIPDNADHIRELIGYVRDYPKTPGNPMVIHCSAGCGRTGTICAIDYCWSLLKEERYPVELTMFDIIKHFRQQRMSMVQTPDQYELAHLVLRALCEKLLEEHEDHNYENYDLPFNNAPEESSDEVYCNVQSDLHPKREEEAAYESVVEAGVRPAPAKPALAPKPVPAPRPQIPEKKAALSTSERSGGVAVTSLAPKSQASSNSGTPGNKVARQGEGAESQAKAQHRPHAPEPTSDHGPSYENFQATFVSEDASSARTSKSEKPATLGRSSGVAAAAAATAAKTKPAPSAASTVSGATGKKLLNDGKAVTVINFSKGSSQIMALGSKPADYENARVEKESQAQQPPASPLKPQLPPQQRQQQQQLSQAQQPPPPLLLKQSSQSAPSQGSGVTIHMLNRPAAPTSKPPPKHKAPPSPAPVAKSSPPPSRASKPPPSDAEYFVVEAEPAVYSLAREVGPDSPPSRSIAASNDDYAEVEDVGSYYQDITPQLPPKKEEKAPKPGTQGGTTPASARPASLDTPAFAPQASSGPPELPRRNYSEDEVADFARKPSGGRSPKSHPAPIPPVVGNSHSGPSRPGGPRRPSNPSATGLQSSNSQVVAMMSGTAFFRSTGIGYKRRVGRVRYGERQPPGHWKKL